MMRKRKMSSDDDEKEKNVLKKNIETEKHEEQTKEEKEVMLASDIESSELLGNSDKRLSYNHDIVKKCDDDVDDIIEKVKEKETILHTEIQGLGENS